MTDIREFFATAPRGVEPLLAGELEALPAREVQTARAGVSFRGTIEVAYRACLWSRVASRILMPVARFPAATPDELYAGARGIEWAQHLAADGSLAVDCQTAQSKVDHSHFAALKVKDAIVDRLRDECGMRPSVDVRRPDLRVNLYLFRDEAQLSLDLAGDSLHRRGYRVRGGEAPLKENLAAAILQRAGWPALAAEGAGLVDVMCGSGTLCIEAAMMAADTAPGLGREYFGFMGWKGFDPGVWRRLIAEATERSEAGRRDMPPITGFDVDRAAVRLARNNAQKAGFGGRVQIVEGELADVSPPEHGKPDAGLVVANPPYGERLGIEQEIEPLYGRLGKLLKNRFGGWSAAMFTGNPKLAGALRLRPRRSYSLFNGPLKCRLLCFEIDRGGDRDQVAPALSSPASAAGEGDGSASADMLANRLRKNRRRLGRWARQNDIHCYRLYDADLPEYALAVDVYAGEECWLHIQEYAPPSSIDPEAAARRREEGVAAAAAVLEVPEMRVFFKMRRRQKGIAQYEKHQTSGRFHEVVEDGCRYWVNFADYLDTGLFLDQRLTRRLIREQSAGAHFLNLFGYTGAASVAAAVGGAASTTTIDLSRTYLDWAQRNLGLNGHTGSEHQLVQADCVAWLREQTGKRQSRRFGLIWLDPPTFSNSKRTPLAFDVQRDHGDLIRAAVALLAPGGVLLFSTNFRRFKMDQTVLGGLDVTDLSAATLALDFERNKRLHHCWRIAALS